MTERLARARLMILFILFLFSGTVFLLQSLSYSGENKNELIVSFLNVGQGDSIYIETPSGKQVLIDGGKDSSVLRELPKFMSITDRSLDLVIGTHPDQDHVGGLVDVLERYEVESILLTENTGESNAAKKYLESVSDEGANIFYARYGQVWQLDASTTLKVLWPEKDPSDLENNASSIVVLLSYGEIDFLLTGDLPKRIEEYLVIREGEYLESEVLKVGHHGSRTSTSDLFLETVNPDYAVLSYAKDNSYGHPHVEVTDLLFNSGIEVLSTAESGNITFSTDGQSITLVE